MVKSPLAQERIHKAVRAGKRCEACGVYPRVLNMVALGNKSRQTLLVFWIQRRLNKFRSCDVWRFKFKFPWCTLGEDSPSLDCSGVLKHLHRAHLATMKKETVISGEIQEDNQNFSWKAGVKNSDRGNCKLKRDGPFANINYRNILIVEENRGLGYIYIPFIILCKYVELSM